MRPSLLLALILLDFGWGATGQKRFVFCIPCYILNLELLTLRFHSWQTANCYARISTARSAPSPSGKAEVCKTFTPSSNLGGALENVGNLFLIALSKLRFTKVLLDRLPLDNEKYTQLSLNNSR